MIDAIDPTTQFHPYQPPETTAPQKIAPPGGLLSKLRHPDLRGQLGKARTAAQQHPGMVLGGLAALVIGAGLMRRHSMSKKVQP